MTSIQRTLLLATVFMAFIGPPASADEPKPSRLPILGNDEAWKLLPRENPPLPAWARILTASLPRTTALQLELDATHRTKNPIDPVLRGKLRWVAADANRSPYAKAYAEADLRRAGLGDADLKQLGGDWEQFPKSDRAALTFARDLTRAAHAVTDEQVADLIKEYGADKFVAMVHTVAHANFQDRILLALGVEVEEGGPFPPLDVRFDPKAKTDVPARPGLKDVDGGKVKAVKLDWLEHSFADLQKALDNQKARKGRIPLPPLETLSKLPPDSQARTAKIVWSRVSMGYQPGLTKAWFDCMGAFQEEASMDRVFTNTMFWVITRSNECFY